MRFCSIRLRASFFRSGVNPISRDGRNGEGGIIIDDVELGTHPLGPPLLLREGETGGEFEEYNSPPFKLIIHDYTNIKNLNEYSKYESESKMNVRIMAKIFMIIIFGLGMIQFNMQRKESK